jgi:hypothetical protein
MAELMAAYSPPMPRGNESWEGRVEGGGFAADAAAREEPEQRELGEVPGERARRGRHDVEPERDEEQAPAAERVREPPEEERAEHRAGEVGTRRGAHLRVGQVKTGACLERPGDGADQRHLEAIEHPCDPEGKHHERMEPAPGQAVESRRDVRLDHHDCRTLPHLVEQFAISRRRSATRERLAVCGKLPL